MDLTKLSGICRGCMSNNNDDLKPLFEYNIFEVFKMCTYTKVHKNDGFPESICSSCLEKCLSWLDFKKQCDKSNEYFHNFLDKKKNLENLEVDSNYEIMEELEDNADTYKELQTKTIKINFKDNEEIEDDNNSLDYNIELTNDNISNDLSVNNSEKICEKCGKIFQTQDQLNVHINRKHLEKKEFYCNECDIGFSSKGNMKRHNEVNHYMSDNKIHSFQCIECEKSYQFPSSLAKHLLIHTNIKSFVCDTCGKAFIHKSGLQSHLLSHSKETPYPCTICDKRFKTDSMLKIHFSRHNSVKNFVCSECGKMFTTSGELTTHSRTHSGVRPYKCQQCVKSFKTISQLYVHLRTHTGDKPFECEFCPQSFSAHEVLKHHRMIHTGEKPHICSLCTKSFRQKSSLRSHMKVHKV